MAAYYFNQGIAYEKGGNPKEAIKSFQFYLLAAPTAPDAREVRKRIAGLEYSMEKAARGSSQVIIAEKKEDPFESLLRKINGRRYLLRDGVGNEHTLDVKGKVLIWNRSWGNFEIRAREFTVQSS